MRYLQAGTTAFLLFVTLFANACSASDYHMTIVEVYPKEIEQQHRQLAYDMALGDVQAYFGSGQSNQFTLRFSHDDVSVGGVTITETFLDPTCSSTSNTGGLTGNDVTVTSSPKEIVSVVSVDFANIGSAIWTEGSGNAWERSSFAMVWKP
jgi:hypothetical protein